MSRIVVYFPLDKFTHRVTKQKNKQIVNPMLSFGHNKFETKFYSVCLLKKENPIVSLLEWSGAG